ncbi:hypothetical protein CRUP_027650 [Coryphaenoides rupestris]|nr:hypothetical protein CRUP_027650 [Coryphaenoides rupestris]
MFRGQIKRVVADSLTEMMDQYNVTEEVKLAVDHMQEDMKCCGLNNASDWENYAADKDSVPDSCCVNITRGCGAGTMTDSIKVHQQIMGILFSCLLMKGIRNGYEVM